ncbi:triphosphoribosyl-dephospho-CoA synthase [Methylomonas sp. LL1]|uniref:triphosphoribosyl-dephospho-CoA synthase n=1 Tax=Methylomonas sp. LL1 TaxID=2785785 RepID=UPI0018C387F0|nr:triphosphoribosyl-dephospho-CoA synthase [Methylomonas sp. LL1]QPK64132.1 triphosphoribosyl-dephospho-CoA synthase [Methylomonas sp. LL1]
MIGRRQVIDAYRRACEIELQAFKPGNVSVYSEGHDMTVGDFRASAIASSLPITNPDYSLGEKIYYAVKATRDAVACNTNLGIILLCAPIIRAAEVRMKRQTLRQSLGMVLQSTTEQDADWVFKAIVLAAPGGLGSSGEQDVGEPATVNLVEAMAIAADKDRIALQYTNCFKDIFDFTVLRYNRAFVLSGESGWAALAVYAEMLARFPDSHIERKYGKQYSEWIAAEMALLCNAMKTATRLEEVLPMLHSIDETFKAKKINPGTTADITVATVLVVLLEQLLDCESDR